MDNKETLKKQIREWIQLGYIAPDDIPTIELYMDQVTTFMDKYLSQNKRADEDKTLTKTMINNYTKNELLPPPNKKRYSKEHIIILIYIYYLKNVISISDIKTMLDPLLENYYDNPDAKHSLNDIYTSLYNMEKYQYFNIENSIVKAYELAEKDWSEDKYLQRLNFLSLLGYDIFMKRKLMEHIIDDMAKEAEEAKAEKDAKSAEKNKNVKNAKNAKNAEKSKSTEKVKAEKGKAEKEKTEKETR